MKLRAALLVASAVTVACSAPPMRAASDVPSVSATLVRASTERVPDRFEVGGIVRAKFTAQIAARILAPITGVRVRPGDRVRQGQTLATLDGRELQAQAARASAGLVAAEQAGRAASADKQAAEAALTLARLSFDRIDGLYARQSATRQELDEATAAIEAARARTAGAEAHVAESTAALAAAQSAASAAAITASYATIAAPFDGTISERFVDPGAIAAPAAPMLTIEDTSAFRLEVRVDEARAAQLVLGQTADVRLDSAEDLIVHARVAEFSRIDSASHAFLVKLDLPRSAGIRSGTFARAVFAGIPRAVLSAPARAIVRRGQLSFVFVVDADHVARLRPITIGAAFGDRVEVLAGLSDGETLVASPPPSLTDGARVTGAHQ